MPTTQSEIPIQNARQGESGRGVRYVLGLALAVYAMVLVPIVAH